MTPFRSFIRPVHAVRRKREKRELLVKSLVLASLCWMGSCAPMRESPPQFLRHELSDLKAPEASALYDSPASRSDLVGNGRELVATVAGEILEVWQAGEQIAEIKAGDAIVEKQIDAELLETSKRIRLRLPELAANSPTTRKIRFDVGPGDRVEDIAERFGVTANEIRRWNRLPARRSRLAPGQELKIWPKRFSAPRMRFKFHVRDGETWDSIARGLGLEVRKLRAMNRKFRRELRARDKISVWVDSAIPDFGQLKSSDGVVIVDVPHGSESVGYPHSGRLIRGQRLPESHHYTLKFPEFAFASTHTMAMLHYSLETFRSRTGFVGEVLITSVSKVSGGRFPPHGSHQSGRDLDIGLVAFPGFGNGEKAVGGRVDWGATWALMRAMIDTGQVQYIFLDYLLQKPLYRAAVAMGESEDDLKRWFQYPTSRRRPVGMIRHAPGHWGHFHVRFNCGPSERRCK